MANDTKVNETASMEDTGEAPSAAKEKKRELLMFLFLTVVFFPVLAVCIVGGYGFIVWVYQMIVGPPGPPGA